MPRFLPDSDESVCANCCEPYLTELAQADRLCPVCRPDPAEALRAQRHARALRDGSLGAELARDRATSQARGAALFAEFQRLRLAGRRPVIVGSSIVCR